MANHRLLKPTEVQNASILNLMNYEMQPSQTVHTEIDRIYHKTFSKPL